MEHSGSAGDPAADTSADRTATRPTAVDGEISSPGTVIVLDAGTRPGRTAAPCPPDGVPESGINLQIVRKAEGLFVFLGRSVRLTRTGEEAIYSPEAQTLREKKVSDLKNRVALINDLPHAVLLSIHQNSMPQHPAVHGAQVFSNPQEPAAGAGAIHPAGAESDSKQRKRKDRQGHRGLGVPHEAHHVSGGAGGVRLPV